MVVTPAPAPMPLRAVRVPAPLWAAAQARAAADGVTLSAAVRALLECYVAGEVEVHP